MRQPYIIAKHVLTVVVLLAAGCLVLDAESNPPSVARPHAFTAEVAKLAAAPTPAPGGILLVGSSIFRKWETCTQDLAPLPVINRAFGGSRTEDQLFFFDQIIPSSRAALIVWYCGSNDVKAGGTPKSIQENTKEWIGRTRAALPHVHILLVSVIRSPEKRDAGQLAQVDEVNNGLRELAGSIPEVAYADVNPAMETSTGEAVTGCYLKDKLHLTPEGYRRMNSILRPTIEKEWKLSSISKSTNPP
jgi:lysophospholipase L1-like esterase